MWIFFLLLSAVLAAGAADVYATESGLPSKTGETAPIPTTITAKKVTVRKQDSQAVFEGTVVLARGPLLVHSDKMVVLFHAEGQENGAGQTNSGKATRGEKSQGRSAAKPHEPPPGLSNHSVNRVEAIDHVQIKYAGGNATCQKAVYFSDGDKIVLTGDPVAWEKGTRVSGKQITIYLKEERSVVEGDSRVHIEGESQGAP
jgi:lipopolysaccharide export system protein LptA